MTTLMHVYTCATFISLHPVTSPRRDKSCAEEICHSWPMMGTTSVLRQRRGEAFTLTLIESKQSPFTCGGSRKSTALAHKQPCAFPISPPQHTHTYTHTHACTNMECTCLWLCTESFCSWGFTSCRDGVEGQFCPIVGFLQKSRLCRLPLEMCWISAFLYQLAFFLHVAVIRATDKTCENELIFLLNSSNYTESK